jgi:hypothetical protein
MNYLDDFKSHPYVVVFNAPCLFLTLINLNFLQEHLHIEGTFLYSPFKTFDPYNSTYLKMNLKLEI